jgi:hypothetical protein
VSYNYYYAGNGALEMLIIIDKHVKNKADNIDKIEALTTELCNRFGNVMSNDINLSRQIDNNNNLKRR